MMRLDRALAARGLARSRTEAQALIAAGQVRVDGRDRRRSRARWCTDEATLTVAGERCPYVSRGGLKLAAALDELRRPGRRTDGTGRGGLHGRLHGLPAAAGRGARGRAWTPGTARWLPLSPPTRASMSREGVNARFLTPADFDAPFDLIVADLSFISLTLVLPALAPLLRPDGDMIVLVKPQFEVGAARIWARAASCATRRNGSGPSGASPRPPPRWDWRRGGGSPARFWAGTATRSICCG